MSNKKSFIVELIVAVLTGLLKGVLKGHFDVERQAIEEWNAEERARFEKSFGNKEN